MLTAVTGLATVPAMSGLAAGSGADVLLGAAGPPLAPGDLWSAWNTDPLVLSGLLLAAVAYGRGRPGGHGRPGGRGRRTDVTRAWCFAAALVALAVALVSPLDALAGALASAHMVQHVLLVLIAAPLLAFSAPSSTLLRGTPLPLRQAGTRWRRKLRLTERTLRPLSGPAVVWLAHVAVLWFWHAAGPYDAALRNPFVHFLEHATFLLTGVLFWRVVVGARGGPTRVSPGFGVLLVFAMAMQSVLLSVLLTFAQTPWYSGYATTTAAWGLEPLADQQLAGAIMWIPAGLIHVGVALGLLVTWLQSIEREHATV